MSASDRAARWARALAVPAALGLSVMVSGCGSSKSAVDRSCPRMVVAPNTETITFFGPGGHDAKDLTVGGRITGGSAHCVPEKAGVAVNAEIHFYAQRANLQIKDATFPYFLALVDAQQHVLAQEAYQLHVEFNPGESYREIPTEKLTVHLPLRDKTTAGDFALIIGFQLTPEQLAFNRAAMAR